MRILAVVAVAAVSLALAGCYVQSVHPLYMEDNLTFDPGLVGAWADPEESDEPVVFEVLGEDVYKVTLVEDGTSVEYEGRLVQLGESVYLDMFPSKPRRQGAMDDFIPLHFIFRIQRDGDELMVAGINFEWLEKKIKSNEINIPHIRFDGRIIFTGEVEQLQDAVIGLAGTEGAFEEPMLTRRVK